MAPGVVTLPAHTLYHNLRSGLFQRDNGTFWTDPDAHRSRIHTIHAKPFNHLSVWAYLAFAFIVLAITTIVAYLLYTCYHSSKRNMIMVTATPEAHVGQEDIQSWEYCGPTSNFGVGANVGSMAKMRIGEVGEKVNVRGSRGGRNDVEMKGFASGHKKTDSDSEASSLQPFSDNIFSLPSNSLSSVSNMNERSLELNDNYLSSPPLAHISDKAAAYIPFHLPPPPPSPTPAYKEHLERQYRGKAQRSPVSPSPSFSPITPRVTSLLDHDDSYNNWSAETAAGNHNSYRKHNGQSSKNRAPPVQFDSNNIRFVPPLNPFMTPSTILLWKDPKLSPIHGSIISNAANTSGSSAGNSSFSKAVLAASRGSPHEASGQGRTKGSVPVIGTQRREDKENQDPSSFHINSNTNPLHDRSNTKPL